MLKCCVDEIAGRIENEKIAITNRELIGLCRDYVRTLPHEVNPHIYHEIAETALNTVIGEKYAKNLLHSPTPEENVAKIIKPLAARLPTQTWRSREQTLLQQFSTPPAIAYLLAYLLNLKPGEQILEPSAGTGGLAIWASGSGLETHTNEIDPRRRELLEILGFQPTAHNAEFINDFLPGEISADVLMMNPPFSSSGGRTANNSSRFGFRHVSSTLERLRKGGKFGIILGDAAGLDTKTGNDFWRETSRRASVKATIKIDGREYYKMGTTVDVTLIVGTKRLAEQTIGWQSERQRIVSVAARSVEDAFGLASEFNLRLE